MISNLRTREEWLQVILHSGEVTRIGQHLALVIYHLADPATNTAKLSARDLERITGWGRTAIIDHLTELEVFIRVTWGAGRAKSIFELQGVITEVIEAQRAATQATATADTQVDTTDTVHQPDTETATTPDTTVSVQETDAQADTKADTNPSVRLTDHNYVRQTDTNVQNQPVGGTIGGENNNYPSVSESLSHQVPTAAPPAWMVHDDGSFDGTIYELPATEVAGLMSIYNYLDFPSELVAADQFLAREFDRAGTSLTQAERMARLHQYLAKKNRDVRELRLRLGMLADNKPTRKPMQPITEPAEPTSCWFDNEARLQTANGFKVELLELVGGDETRLRSELDKAAGFVGVNTKGPQLVAKVRSSITKSMEGKARPSSDKAGGQTRRERIRQYIEEAQPKQETRSRHEQ